MTAENPTTPQRQPLLTVRGLSIGFGDPTEPGREPAAAVIDADWELRPGQVTALVGESGSGKSVSAMAVLGLLPGTATVAGSVLFTPPEGGEPLELVGLRCRALHLLTSGPTTSRPAPRPLLVEHSQGCAPGCR